MTFAGRIRFFLIVAAVLPPLFIISFIYFQGVSQVKGDQRQKANQALEKYLHFDNAYMTEMQQTGQRLKDSEMIQRAAQMINSGQTNRVNITGQSIGFDYLELLDSNLVARVSRHRGGLIGNKIHDQMVFNKTQPSAFYETVEYDTAGIHAAISYLLPIEENIYLYCGWYMDARYLELVGGVITAELELYYDIQDIPDLPRPEMMVPMTLYEHEQQLYALLHGGTFSDYYLIAYFETDPVQAPLLNLLRVTAVIALVAILIAVMIGIYISGKAKREVNNLVEATERVARGDFDTAIMAYEEGEFARLADSFSDMVSSLKKIRKDLATSEKIAAWKIVGQKVAHEIKNPLTPITISLDDLQYAYSEKRDDFDAVFKETTATIKSEISRMTRMLNEFVAFARMKPPELRDVPLDSWLDSVRSLYKNEIDNERLTINIDSSIVTIVIDPDSFKQVLINLIKNSLEASEQTRISLNIIKSENNLDFQIDDNGPGFTKEILENAFMPYMTTKKDGSGLGLAVCQRIVFDHGGTIELQNKDEGGARVLLTLPIK